MTSFVFRELTAAPADRDVLRRFHRGVYGAEFPDPDERESLANIERYLELKTAGWYGDNNYHVLIVESEGEIAGGAIADFLAEPNAGVIEFLVVAPGWRRAGLGRRLLDRTEEAICLDARRIGRPAPAWIVAEINDPFRIDLGADSLDPFLRARIWGQWGFRKLDFPYVQPALSETQRPVHHLLLAVKFVGERGDDAVPSPALLATLRSYLRWAMRIENADANTEYRAMRDDLARVASVPSIPLDRYVDGEPRASLAVDEVVGRGADLDAVITVYTRAFPSHVTTLEPSVLRDAVGRTLDGGRYHLWAIREARGAPVTGMASFFSLPSIGFGGYIAFDERLRGRGRLRAVVARIEQAMCRDATGARGWLIECEPGSHALQVFSHLGFREIVLEYRQPPLPGQPSAGAPTLALAYKEFGVTARAPALTRTQLRAAMRAILRAVYRVSDPEHSPFLGALDAEMRQWPAEDVPWRTRAGRSPQR